MNARTFRIELGGEDVREESLHAFAALSGFDLVAWDEWLSALEPCPAKAELMERREAAKHAKNSDAMLRHLEWMQRRRVEIVREDSLLPLARTGDKVQKPRKRANAERQKVADARHARWQQQAEALWAQPRHAGKSISNIARLIDPNRAGTIRNIIRKPKK